MSKKMSKITMLDFQYRLSKGRLSPKPSQKFSRQSSGISSLPSSYQPNLCEMRKVFDKFDSNKDGKISQQEYKAVMEALGKESLLTELNKIFEVADLDGDGFINFKEYLEVHKKEGGVKTVDIQSAFRIFDLNGDGKISAEEVLQVLRRLGERCSLEDCRRMVRAVDSNEDGSVSMDEFMTMMTHTMRIG